MFERTALALASAALLSACSSGAGRTPIVSNSRPAPGASVPMAQPNTQSARRPVMQREVGFEGVIGARASALIGQLGQPRIDLSEGDARKLQFSTETCVLDIFLYPTSPGAEPVATHVAARNREGGAQIEAANCLRELVRR